MLRTPGIPAVSLRLVISRWPQILRSESRGSKHLHLTAVFLQRGGLSLPSLEEVMQATVRRSRSLPIPKQWSQSADEKD